MSKHVYRPLYVVAVLISGILITRAAIVPSDFGVGARGYMYAWHRSGNEQEWQNFTPKFKPKDYCKDCHSVQWTSIHDSPHGIINCQNCHGPARNHPEDPAKLTINRSRNLCIRCHAELPYAASGRTVIRGIDPEKHNPGVECASCHNPHQPIAAAIQGGKK